MTNIKSFSEGNHEVRKNSIVTVATSTMNDTNEARSPSLYIPQEHVGEFEKHTRGIDSIILTKMGYNRLRI